MNVLCKQIDGEIKKTNKICEFYSDVLKNLSNYSSSMNINEQNQNLNKSYYDKIFRLLNKLNDLYEIFNESATSEKLEPLMIINYNNLNLFLKNKYTIKPAYLKKFHPNYESNCIIVNIDNNNELFYIYDIAYSSKYDEHHKKLNELYSNKSLQLIEDEIPKLSEVFGIILNNKMYRATRENTLITNNDKFYNVYLLDYGKIIEISIGNEKIYKLPVDLQNEPSLAICCKLDSLILHDNSYGDRQTFFTEALHKKYYFYVQSVDNNESILNIKLITNSNPFLSYLNDNEYNWFDNTAKNQYNNKSNEKKKNLGNELSLIGLTDDCTNNDNNIPIPYNELNTLSINNNNKLTNGLTKEEYDILMEEPLNTSNALYATLGYIPKDEKLICPFNENGKCFKGGRCRLEHKQIINEGWTRDTKPAIIDINMKLIYPQNDAIISIIGTHIINAEYFFAQIIQKNNLYATTLRELTWKMNSEEEIIKYKQFTTNSLPLLDELILAKYSDGHFYRAKIIDFAVDDYYKIFYVDYGNFGTVVLDNIRKWESKFECLPFQAVSFHLDGIRYIKETRAQAEEYIRKQIINKVVQAKVINNYNDIIVQIKLHNNCDLSEELIRLGYARKAKNFEFKNKSIHYKNIHQLPG